MCLAKPGPRCTRHAVEDFYGAKEALEKASTLEEKEIATAELLKAQKVFDTTPRGQSDLMKEIAHAKNLEERAVLHNRILQGATLRAQQATAFELGLEPDADVTGIKPCNITSFVNESGDVMVRLTAEDGTVIREVISDEYGINKLRKISWDTTKTVPYIHPATSVEALYADDAKAPKWALAENINTTRIHEMLPEGFRASREGASDSTVSDIAIRNSKNEIIGYTEVKLDKAQAGQIVVERSGEGFAATNLNDSNPYTNDVVSIINRQSDSLREKSNGEQLKYSTLPEEDKKTVANWFKHHYTHKNAAFIAVTNSDLTYTSVFPLKKLEENAEVTICMPRAKKSGSSHLSKKMKPIAAEKAKATFNVEDVYENNGRTSIAIDADKNPELYFGDNKEFYLSFKEPRQNEKTGKLENTYEIKKLSATDNMTLMFNFEYKGEKKTQGRQALNAWARSTQRKLDKENNSPID